MPSLSLPRPARRLLSPTPLPQPVPADTHAGDEGLRQFAIAACITLVWLALVLVGARSHELWRDEVRALTLATEPSSLAGLFASLRGEGHPALWYLLLRTVHRVTGSALTLPALSIAVAGGAVWLFVRHAPFPLWQRALFVLGLYPLYEYAVMSRNYGLSMLLLFAWCTLGARRGARPLLAGALLFLLANANVHSVVLVGALLVTWALQTWGPFARPVRSRARSVAGMALAAAGCIVCYLQTRPPADSIFANGASGRAAALLGDARTLAMPGSYFQQAFLGTMARWSVPGVELQAAAVATTLILLAVALVLTRRPSLLAGFACAVAGLLALFSAVYPGFPRHQGLLFVFALAMLWMLHEPAPERPSRLAIPPRLALPLERWTLGVVLVLQVLIGWAAYRHDLRHSLSSAGAMGAWLRNSPRYSRAALVGEPDYSLEALPYHASNPLYSPREERVTRATRWTRRNVRPLSLDDLVGAARRARATLGVPVLIAIGHPRGLRDSSASLTYSFGYRFGWTPEQHRRFRAATRQVARFDGARGDENWELYELR